MRPSLVVPPGTYSGRAILDLSTPPPSPNAFRVAVPTGLCRRPAEQLLARLPATQGELNDVGRGAAEPTIGVNANNVAFFAASTFDFPTPTFPVRLARTLVMRSLDRGKTWQAVSPPLAANLPDREETLTFPPNTLDPMVHVDPIGLKPATKTGRVFSVDLNAACGANTIFSDDQGAHWTSVPLFAWTPRSTTTRRSSPRRLRPGSRP